MGLEFTKRIELGYKAPGFSLLEPKSGDYLSLDNFASGKALVVMFICNHCPYVKHVNQGLVKLANTYLGKGINFVAISSNDVDNYPDDSPELMVKTAREEKYPFPYLYDKTQEVAKAYNASCTPDFSVFDKDLRCVYRGQMDDSRPGNNIPVTGDDLAKVLDNLLQGKPVNSNQTPSAGCSIKWKK